MGRVGKIDIAQCFGNLVNELVRFRRRIDEYKFRGGPLEITGGGGRGERFSVDSFLHFQVYFQKDINGL